MTYIKALYRYPIKSLGRETLEAVKLKDYGLEYDRNCMLVDAEHQMLTQRELPQLTKLLASVSKDVLTISNKETEESFRIAVNECSTESIGTSIWGTNIVPSIVSQLVNEWLSDQINERISLVAAGDQFERTRVIGEDAVRLRFADGYPILVLSQASVDHLNEKLEEPVDESRFRANIIIDGCPAHSEDLSVKMTFESTAIEIINPCKRCIMINTNQLSGDVSKEPLKTLATYRATDNKVLFGMNARATTNGDISINELVKIDLKR